MPFPDISTYGLRIPYDIDDSTVTSYSITDNNYQRQLSSAEMTTLNSASSNYVEFDFGDFPAGLTPGSHYGELRVLFAQPMIITAMSLRCINGQGKTTQAVLDAGGGIGYQSGGWIFQGSTIARSLQDATDWAEPLYPNGDVVNGTSSNYVSGDDWRNYIWKTNFTASPLTAVRFILCNQGASQNYRRVSSVQLYGLRADVTHGEDVEFVKANGTQDTSVLDYGLVAYPSTYEKTFYLMNTSLTKSVKSVHIEAATEDPQNDPTPVLDINTTNTFNAPSLSAPLTQVGSWNTTSPPATNQATAQEISGMFISVTVQRPCYITFTGNMWATGVGNTGYQNFYVDVYRDDFYYKTTKVWTVNGNEYSGTITFEDYIEEIGIHTYNYKAYSLGWDAGAGPYIQVYSAYMVLSWTGNACNVGNIGPRTVVPLYSKLVPGAGTAPIALRYVVTHQGFTSYGFGFSTAQATVV